jgi:hypothetical protein
MAARRSGSVEASAKTASQSLKLWASRQSISGSS